MKPLDEHEIFGAKFEMRWMNTENLEALTVTKNFTWQQFNKNKRHEFFLCFLHTNNVYMATIHNYKSQNNASQFTVQKQY